MMVDDRAGDGNGRRAFCRACLGGMGAAGAGMVAAPLVSFLQRPTRLEAESTIRIPLSELKEDEAIYRDLQGIQIVILLNQGVPLVINAACTHLGCLVRWEHSTRTFICPCHGAVFDQSGKVLRGPTNQPLAVVPSEVKDGVLIVG
jgi:cytochrome b6-f complex iron-sulfur subunit